MIIYEYIHLHVYLEIIISQCDLFSIWLSKLMITELKIWQKRVTDEGKKMMDFGFGSHMECLIKAYHSFPWGKWEEEHLGALQMTEKWR